MNPDQTAPKGANSPIWVHIVRHIVRNITIQITKAVERTDNIFHE